jgi:hypothetical protein
MPCIAMCDKTLLRTANRLGNTYDATVGEEETKLETEVVCLRLYETKSTRVLSLHGL